MWAARGNRLTSLLVVTVLVLSYSVSSSAKRSRASRLSERRSIEVKQEENKDSERDVVSNTGHKSDFNVANENGESQCKDCLQAPVINIRVSTSSRRSRGNRRRGRRRHGHGQHNSRQTAEKGVDTHGKRQRSRSRSEGRGATPGTRTSRQEVSVPRTVKSGRDSVRRKSAARDSVRRKSAARDSTRGDSAPKRSTQTGSSSEGSARRHSAVAKDSASRVVARAETAPGGSAAAGSAQRDAAQRDSESNDSTTLPTTTTERARKKKKKKKQKSTSAFSWFSSLFSSNEDSSETEATDTEDQQTTPEATDTEDQQTTPKPTPAAKSETTSKSNKKSDKQNSRHPPRKSKSESDVTSVSRTESNANKGTHSLYIEQPTDVSDANEKQSPSPDLTEESASPFDNGRTHKIRKSKKKASSKNRGNGRKKKSKTHAVDSSVETPVDSETSELQPSGVSNAVRKSSAFPETHGSSTPEAHRHGSRSPEEERHGSRNSDPQWHRSRDPEAERHTSRTPEAQRHGSRTPEAEGRGSRIPAEHRHAPRTPESRRHGSRTSESQRHGSQTSEAHKHGSRTSETHRHGSRTPEAQRHSLQTSEAQRHGSLRPEEERHGSRNSDPQWHRSRDPETERHTSRSHVSQSHGTQHRSRNQGSHDRRQKEHSQSRRPPSAQTDRDRDPDRPTSSRMLSALLPDTARYQSQVIDPRARYGSRYGPRLYSGGRGRGGNRGDYVRRPAAADRLERRLFPSFADAADRLVKSVNRVVGVLNNGLQFVHQENEFVFNGTRYTIMMGVREQLMAIAKANDMVYDTVLRATLLTKDIYMRAHRSRMTGPTTRSLARPEVSLPSLYDVIQKAYADERSAVMKLRDVKDMQRKALKLNARMQQVREKFQDGFARNDLRTLVYYINSTAQKLNWELMYSTRTMYVRRTQAILYASRDNITVARDLLLKADDFIARGTHDYRGNYRVAQDWKRRRSDDGGVGPPVSFRKRPPTTDVSRDDVRRIRTAIARMQRHAVEQEMLAAEAERILRPSIVFASRSSDREEARAAAWLASIATRLDTAGKKLYAMLDSIRVTVGAEQELRWVTSFSATACRDREGSGDDGRTDDDDGDDCLPEGSGDLVLTDGEGEEGEEGSGPVGPPTDDEDFVFVDESQPPRRRPSKPTSLAEFKQKLSVHIDGLRLRSHDVLQRADDLYETTFETSRRWAAIKESADMAERAREGWKEVQEMERNVTFYVNDVSEVAKVLHQEVTRSHASIEKRMKKAAEVAERKLAEAQARKSGTDAGQPQRDRPASDDNHAVVEAVEKVNAVRDNHRAIEELRRVAPRTCGRASSRLQSLHGNITHLRRKVHEAKVLLQSLQLSISKSGSGYLSIPTLAEDYTPSLTTTVEVCIKTTDTDGPVLLVKGNNSATFSLAMDDRQIVVTVFDAEGYNLDSVTSDLTLAEDKWYNVKVTRTGHTVSLKVTSKDGADTSENQATMSSLALTQSTPIQAYVGGAPDSEPFSIGSSTWRGCLGGLHVNRRALSLMHTSSEREAPKVCTDQCSRGSDGGSLIFDGAGFLHYSASVLPMRRRMESVHFRFRSRQASAALIHLVNQRQRFLLRVLLTEGAIMIDTTTPTESIILRSRNNNYNDGEFHSLRVQYRDSTTYPEIDGKDGGFTIERTRPQNINGMADGVVVGAFVTSAHAFEESEYRPLIGCVQELEIDDEPLSIADAEMARGVFEGSCDGDSLWSSCVGFGADSSGIDLGSLDKSGTIVILFSPDARGPLLGYAREGKFEAEISVTDQGLTVTTEEDEETLSRPDDVKEDFTMLTINDDGKTVTYSAWGDKAETTYGGFWVASADVDGPHLITVAMPLESSDRQLVGSVAQLMVGKRYIDFGNYTLSNNLSACKRPLPDLVKSEVLPEVTTQPDSESTCSRDIRC